MTSESINAPHCPIGWDRVILLMLSSCDDREPREVSRLGAAETSGRADKSAHRIFVLLCMEVGSSGIQTRNGCTARSAGGSGRRWRH